MDNQLPPITPEVKTYLETLLQDAGKTESDPTKQEQNIQELYKKLDEFIANVVVESMPEDKIDAFVKLNEDKRPMEEIEQYLKTNMPDAQNVLAKAFVDFKDSYLNTKAE